MLLLEHSYYPMLKKYLYESFPKVLGSSKIAGHMAALGSLDKSSFAAALIPGGHPMVGVVDFFIYNCDLNSHELGVIKSLQPAKFLLSSLLVARFEDDPFNPRNYFMTASGQSVPMVGAVLLHMLCDWGARRYAGITLTLSSNHPGYNFERAVYGRVASIMC